ncbi:hypothetical protein [Niallia sp. 01092]|uniref:hypothetical protein n=1 Tax=unclassified Niallia TaxID=2837522 RepID=UPI003FD05C82
MIKRKILTTCITFVISTFFIAIFTPPSSFLADESDFFSNILISMLYVGLAVILYGLPGSLLVEIITKKFKEARLFFAFAFHLILGIAPVLFLWFLTFYSIGISCVFFLVDEALRYTLDKKSRDK